MWYPKNDVILNWSKSEQIVKKIGPHGNSIFASENIAKNSLLVKMNSSSLLTPSHAARIIDEKLQKLNTTLHGNDILAIFLFFESQNESSKLKWMIDELPKVMERPFMLDRNILRYS